MAQRSVSSFKSTKNTRYADNSSGGISEQDSRDMFEDVADSFLNRTDDLQDDDTFDSASASKVPSSESVKAYVDAQVGDIDPTDAGSNFTAGATVTNVSALTLNSATIYSRIGNVATISARFSVTPTASGVCVFELSPPIASAFTSTTDVTGIVTGYDDDTDTSLVGTIAANTTNDKLRFTFTAPNTNAWIIAMTGQYIIKE